MEYITRKLWPPAMLATTTGINSPRIANDGANRLGHDDPALYVSSRLSTNQALPFAQRG